MTIRASKTHIEELIEGSSSRAGDYKQNSTSVRLGGYLKVAPSPEVQAQTRCIQPLIESNPYRFAVKCMSTVELTVESCCLATAWFGCRALTQDQVYQFARLTATMWIRASRLAKLRSCQSGVSNLSLTSLGSPVGCLTLFSYNFPPQPWCERGFGLVLQGSHPPDSQPFLCLASVAHDVFSFLFFVVKSCFILYIAVPTLVSTHGPWSSRLCSCRPLTIFTRLLIEIDQSSMLLRTDLPFTT
jgi:hypothetical protein